MKSVGKKVREFRETKGYTLDEFAREYGQKSETNGKVYVNIDLMKSRDSNKSYMKLNTWKPKAKEEDKPLIKSKDEAFEEDDIPF